MPDEKEFDWFATDAPPDLVTQMLYAMADMRLKSSLEEKMNGLRDHLLPGSDDIVDSVRERFTKEFHSKRDSYRRQFVQQVIAKLVGEDN